MRPSTSKASRPPLRVDADTPQLAAPTAKGGSTPQEAPEPAASPSAARGRRARGFASPPPSRTARRPRPARRPPPTRLVETAGPEPGTPLDQVRLVVGTVDGPHGVRGELKLRLATDDPEHLRAVKRVYLGNETEPRRLLGVRFHAGRALLRVERVTTPEAVDALRGLPVRIAGADARPLAAGEFFLYQLVGLEAVDEAGRSLGRVTDLLETGSHDVFVVTPSGGSPDVLLPNHPDVVLDVRPAEGRMVVRPPVYLDEEHP